MVCFPLFDVCKATVSNVRRRFAQGGLEAVLNDNVQHRHSALSGLQTAHLIAVACSTAPDGHEEPIAKVIRPPGIDGLDLLPATLALTPVGLELATFP